MVYLVISLSYTGASHDTSTRVSLYIILVVERGERLSSWLFLFDGIVMVLFINEFTSLFTDLAVILYASDWDILLNEA